MPKERLGRRSRCAGFHYQDKRLAHFKPIRELHLYQGMRKRTPKRITKTIASARIFMKFEAKFVCSVYAVSLVRKGFLSSKMAQITDYLTEEKLRQIILWADPQISSVITNKAFPQTHLWKSSIPIAKHLNNIFRIKKSIFVEDRDAHFTTKISAIQRFRIYAVNKIEQNCSRQIALCSFKANSHGAICSNNL